MQGLFSKREREIMQQATKLDTGGMTAFTSYWFAPANPNAKPRWDLVATPPDTWALEPDEYVPWVPLDWTVAVAHGTISDSIIIGGWGCLRGDQRIYDVEHGHVPIQQMAEERYAPKVMAWADTEFVPAQAHAPVLMGNDDYLEVTTQDGHQIVVTPDHRFLTPTGWSHLRDLSVGQKIGVGEYDLSYQAIQEIASVGHGPYYDLHVPGYENYLAEGFVNHNCGKTLGVGAMGVYYCSMMPNFKFLNVANVSWQAKQMWLAVRNELFDWDNRRDFPRNITKLVEKIIASPHPLIKFKNGSTMEFLSADRNGSKIRSWSGDMAVIDEAGLIEDGFQELRGNLGSRLRGAAGGRVRLGKMVIMSNADYNPELWDAFDEGSLSDDVASILLTSYDNPYLTEKQLKNMFRRAGGGEKARQMMNSERPLPQGKEFTTALITKCQSKSLDHIMESGLEEEIPGFVREEARKAGIIKWSVPFQKHQRNIIIGDPGQSNPPDRNSAVAMVFDISAIPHGPAELVSFDWIYGNGSYWPFIYRMEELHDIYRPVYSGFDATGTQKSFDELVFTQRGRIFSGLNVAGKKQAMVVALKLLMGRGLISMPKELKSVWLQLANWHMPDTKLRQDIASCLFMVGDVISDIMVEDQGEDDSEEVDYTSYGRNEVNRALSTTRNIPMR